MSNTKLDKIIDAEYEVEAYLENVSTDEFKADVQALMKKYSDNGAIDEAIEFLERCRK